MNVLQLYYIVFFLSVLLVSFVCFRLIVLELFYYFVSYVRYKEMLH